MRCRLQSRVEGRKFTCQARGCRESSSRWSPLRVHGVSVRKMVASSPDRTGPARASAVRRLPGRTGPRPLVAVADVTRLPAREVASGAVTLPTARGPEAVKLDRSPAVEGHTARTPGGFPLLLVTICQSGASHASMLGSPRQPRPGRRPARWKPRTRTRLSRAGVPGIRQGRRRPGPEGAALENERDDGNCLAENSSWARTHSIAWWEISEESRLGGNRRAAAGLLAAPHPPKRRRRDRHLRLSRAQQRSTGSQQRAQEGCPPPSRCRNWSCRTATSSQSPPGSLASTASCVKVWSPATSPESRAAVVTPDAPSPTRPSRDPDAN